MELNYSQRAKKAIAEAVRLYGKKMQLIKCDGSSKCTFDLRELQGKYVVKHI